MLSDWSFILVITIMAAATFATRVAGAVLMARVTPTARTERFLDGLSVSVIAALVASQLMTADVRNVTAVAVAVAVMFVSRSVVWAMFAGMMFAAAVPFIIAI
ncbi:MAG: AzlD domain-containing protein [Pseudomonadota bacterium]